jgi:hypothetical protein
MGERRKHTLCWDCENAVEPEICPWVNDGSPVPGWCAVRTKIHSHRTPPNDASYCVIHCPLFKRDSVKGGRRYWKEGDPI